ncbi:MAG: exonuclease SbcCD subunit D [Actinomycetota bacterium]
MVKILHTGDWHVGRSIQGHSRLAEHEAVAAEIVEIARTEAVDVVLVAGDLFDSAAPAPESERLVYRTLLDLGGSAGVVVIPGNHDNERRFGAVAPLFALAGVTIVASVGPQACREIRTRSGETVRLALLPWLSQRYVVKADQLMSSNGAELAGQYAERVGRIIAVLTADFSEETVNVVLGHVTILGGQLGGGERTAQTVFDYCVHSSVFPSSAHYVALGHLHKAQAIAGACPIHYCGSPLQLDFSESHQDKCVLVVEARAGTPAEVREVPLRSGRNLQTLSGTLEELAKMAGRTGADYLRVKVTEPSRAGLADAVRELFPHAVQIIPDRDSQRKPGAPPRACPATSPQELFARYLEAKGIRDERMLALFGRLYEEAHETQPA